MLWLTYRRALPRRYDLAELEPPASAIRDHAVFSAAFPLLAALLVAYFILAAIGVPVSAVTATGALVLLAVAGRWHRGGRGHVISVGKVLRGAPWQIVVFSLGMYLVVYGLRNSGLTGYLAAALVRLAAHGPWLAALGTGFGAAILSSVMNNMPGVLVGALSIDQARQLPATTRELMAYANVIGCDLGPKFTPIGSLATPAVAACPEHEGHSHHLGTVYAGRPSHHPAGAAGRACGTGCMVAADRPSVTTSHVQGPA